MFGPVGEGSAVGGADMVAKEEGAGNCAADESTEKKPSRTDHRLLRLLSDRPTVLGRLGGPGVVGLPGFVGELLSPISMGCWG